MCLVSLGQKCFYYFNDFVVPLNLQGFQSSSFQAKSSCFDDSPKCWRFTIIAPITLVQCSSLSGSIKWEPVCPNVVHPLSSISILIPLSIPSLHLIKNYSCQLVILFPFGRKLRLLKMSVLVVFFGFDIFQQFKSFFFNYYNS